MTNERSVAVSTVTGSRICGCSSKLRCDFSVTRGWQQMRNAIRWIKQFAEKVLAKFVTSIWKRQKLSILQRHPVWHRCCHWINNANSSPLNRLNHFCLIFPQAMVPNNCTVLKNWSGRQYRTEQFSQPFLLSPDKHHSSDIVHWREGKALIHLKTADASVHMTGHNCGTWYSTEWFWQYFLWYSRQSS